jgi:predicted branched-subunit amino acid permease
VNESFRRGLRAGAPFSAVGFLLSMSFGVLAIEAGFSAVQTIVMSAVVHAGSAQFATAAIVAGGGGLVPGVLAGTLMNARFLAMGIAVAPSLPNGPVVGHFRLRRSSTRRGLWRTGATVRSTGTC